MIPKLFVKYSNDTNDIYENIGEHNPSKECKTLILFENMIGDMLKNRDHLIITFSLRIRH